jgi:hypothetical protein
MRTGKKEKEGKMNGTPFPVMLVKCCALLGKRSPFQLRWKKPTRVWGSFVRWTGSEMRLRQDRETHLKRHRERTGTRRRISTRRSSVRLAGGFLFPGGSSISWSPGSPAGRMRSPCPASWITAWIIVTLQADEL